MRVERVALEDHRDVTVLGLNVVYELAVDVELAARNLFQAGNHAQRRRFAAARRANEHHELAVGHLEVEILNSEHALVRHLEVWPLLLAVLGLVGTALAPGMWVDLLDMPQTYLCHGMPLLIG